MNSEHLSDEALQAYLFKEVEDDASAAHLSACSICRERLDEYRFLIDRLQETKPEAFSFDLSSHVMDKVLQHETRKRKREYLVYWGILAFAFMVLASFSIPFVPQVLAVFYLDSMLTTLFVLGTGLAVLVFLLADLARQYKTKADRLLKKSLQPIH